MKRLRVEPWMHDELHRRKELYRRLWTGQLLDRAKNHRPFFWPEFT